MAKPIGEILIDQGAITVQQLNQALDAQKSSKQKKRLGEILIDLGMIDESNIVSALSSQFGFPYLSLKSITFNRDVCNVISKETAMKYCVIPIDKVNNTLYIIMSDPSDEKSIAELEKVSQCKIQTFISTSTEIQIAITKQYGNKN